MKRFLASLFVMVLASPAFSADFPARIFVAPTQFAPAFTWAGFYIGSNAGYSWNESRSRFSPVLSGADEAEITQFNASGVLPRRLGRSSNGFAGGGQVGYNHQLGQIVLGLEADLQYLGARQRSGHVSVLSDDFQTVATATTTESRLDWLGTLRGRAGFAFDRTLVYGTGGLAFGRTSSRTTIGAASADGAAPYAGVWSGTKTRTSIGWSIGAGVEHALTDNLTLKAEYPYYDLGRTRYTASGFSTDPDDGFRGATARRKASGNIMRAGLNWKFSTFQGVPGEGAFELPG